MGKHFITSAGIVGLSLSLAFTAVADPGEGKDDKEKKEKKVKASEVPELGTEGLASAGLVVLAGSAILMSRRRRSAAL